MLKLDDTPYLLYTDAEQAIIDQIKKLEERVAPCVRIVVASNFQLEAVNYESKI